MAAALLVRQDRYLVLVLSILAEEGVHRAAVGQVEHTSVLLHRRALSGKEAAAPQVLGAAVEVADITAVGLAPLPAEEGGRATRPALSTGALAH